jgi:poly(glycerol-phosphate) alpha-glucosyltransferase
MYTSVRRLAQALMATGKCDVRVVAPQDPDTDADLDSWSPVPVEVVPPEPLLGYLHARHVGAFLDRYRPALCHRHGMWLYPSAAVHAWCRRTNTPYLVSPRNALSPLHLQRRRLSKAAIWTGIERSHLAGAACVHALTSQECKDIRAAGIRNPVCVIPNGIDIPGVPSDGQSCSLPVAGVDRGRHRTLVYIGRLHPYKGLDTLIMAWSLAATRLGGFEDRWRLVIAGPSEGGTKAGLARLAAHLGVVNSVVLLDGVYGSEKWALLRQAWATILPSRSEGLPIAALESFAAGRQALLTPECNLPDSFAAQAAMRIEHEPEAIFAAIAALDVQDEAVRARLGERARAFVASRHSWDEIAARMAAVYRWAVGSSPSPCGITF